jgi:hypothetical protein
MWWRLTTTTTYYKLDGPVGEDFDRTCPTCYNTSKRSEQCPTRWSLLFTSTHHYGGEVQFMISDIKDLKKCHQLS